ncbi:EKC/KEOPS complex subunit TPRKB-like [Uloborus diversus]|uniref:EKC/KEOPS complex subunit TPRKB-like n=1 Tax=Uloborus diversus TaxID=327109 RepID=UPI00240A97D8|nr:EKC/KEOPS complex subunit TPRKB-like [Uloborus diversus]XP_054717961.1 EKC/KEOPS complex subunit TPRKB-like [Uloborus diversus]XP_054723830.1 EKC/KEOPS complex subunit TPRKB-like [Uloborus diversus]
MDEESEFTVIFLFYQDIENMKEIKDLLANNCLKAAVVNPLLIYDKSQLLLASHRSLYNEQNKIMKTKSIFTEVLYNLFPSKSIRDSLRTFGAHENGTSAIFVVFGKESKTICDQIKNCVKGQLSSVDQVSESCDIKAVRKLYKIPNEVSEQSDILNFILTKIASKEILL